MNRTIAQAVSAVSGAVAGLVRRQVRSLRSTLKEQRKVALRAAKALRSNVAAKFFGRLRNPSDATAQAATPADLSRTGK